MDYGMGNLGSLVNMFKKLKVETEVASNPAALSSARKVLLPGVGAFDAAMKRINDGGFREVLIRKAKEGVPILGVCLGMQLLMESSEEGGLAGLGFIPGSVHKFSFPLDSGLKVPHMGWKRVSEIKPSPLTTGLPGEPRFYFVHSYYVKAADRSDVVMQTHHGISFDSVIQHDNIFGAQFHPEKSHKFGLRLLENFASL